MTHRFNPLRHGGQVEGIAEADDELAENNKVRPVESIRVSRGDRGPSDVPALRTGSVLLPIYLLLLPPNLLSGASETEARGI